MNEDELKILKMIENGTITAEEGMKLLEAIGTSERKKTNTNTKKTPKNVRVVVEGENKSTPVDVKLPLGLFKAGVKIGEKFSPEFQGAMADVDYEAVLQAIDEGATGEVISVTTEDGHLVKIYIE